MQDDAADNEKVPAEQAPQASKELAPSDDENLPAEQAEQVLDEVAPAIT